MTVSKNLERVTTAAVPALAAPPLPYRLVFLVSRNSPRWFTQLYEALSQTSAYAIVCTDTDSYDDIILGHAPDALIGFNSTGCVNLFTSLVLVEPAHRPLCVLVEHTESDTPPSAADLLCTASPRALRRQLETVLSLRTDLRHAHQRIDRLAAKADRAARKADEARRRFERKLTRLQTDSANKHQMLDETIAGLQAQIDAMQARLVVLEREAADSTVLKEAIFNSVSHEFSTPLLQVKGAVIHLSYNNPGNSLIEMALQSFAKLEAGVQNMKQLASSMEIKLAPVVIREVIQAAARKVENSLIHKDSTDRIRLHIADRLPPVLGDSKSLVAAIQRMIDNALKFSQNTPVDVHAYLDGDRVAVSIQDYGIGIDQEQFEKIFEMFYQVDGTDAKRYGGMGIGLAIVRTILDKHDVRIDVSSHPGSGTTFTFRLQPVNLYPNRTHAD